MTLSLAAHPRARSRRVARVITRGWRCQSGWGLLGKTALFPNRAGASSMEKPRLLRAKSIATAVPRAFGRTDRRCRSQIVLNEYFRRFRATANLPNAEGESRSGTLRSTGRLGTLSLAVHGAADGAAAGARCVPRGDWAGGMKYLRKQCAFGGRKLSPVTSDGCSRPKRAWVASFYTEPRPTMPGVRKIDTGVKSRPNLEFESHEVLNAIDGEL